MGKSLIKTFNLLQFKNSINIIHSCFRSNMPRTKTPFSDAIVFVVGGGNYIEYQNLLDNAKVVNEINIIFYVYSKHLFFKKSKSTNMSQKRIIYGCTDFVNASDLLREV